MWTYCNKDNAIFWRILWANVRKSSEKLLNITVAKFIPFCASKKICMWKLMRPAHLEFVKLINNFHNLTKNILENKNSLAFWGSDCKGCYVEISGKYWRTSEKLWRNAEYSKLIFTLSDGYNSIITLRTMWNNTHKKARSLLFNMIQILFENNIREMMTIISNTNAGMHECIFISFQQHFLSNIIDFSLYSTL